MHFKIFILSIVLILGSRLSMANSIFIAMDDTQSNHLKAYGIAYWTIEQGV